ncbi:MAG: response regulator [bacterium]|nr:response regulator [bacterium]
MSKKVLVVDDHPITRQLTIKILKQLDIEDVSEAGNGREALDFLAENTVALILLDLSMPVMDGTEMLRQMKADDRFAQIPVVMVTAAVEQYRVDEALELGAASCLLKPIAKQPLSDVVSRFLA